MNSSACTVNLGGDWEAMLMIPATGFSYERPEKFTNMGIDLTVMRELATRSLGKTIQTTTAIIDPWWKEEESRGVAVTVITTANRMLITHLGWSREQALETRIRLRAFEEDWNAPGMEGYDDL